MYTVLRVVLVAAITVTGIPLKGSGLIFQVEKMDVLKCPLGLVRHEADVALVLALGDSGKVVGGEFLSWKFISGPRTDFFDRPEEQARVISQFSNWRFSGASDLQAIKVLLRYRIEDNASVANIFCLSDFRCTAGVSFMVSGSDSMTVTIRSIMSRLIIN